MERIGVGLQPFLLARKHRVRGSCDGNMDLRLLAETISADGALVSRTAAQAATRASAPRKVCPAAGTMDHEPPEIDAVVHPCVS